jgi:uncharacterized protein with von Willebrand factor type A (vWA) domain
MRIALALALIVAFASSAPAAPKHVPGALVVVIDRSGSMQGPKLIAAKAATVALVNAMASDDEIAVVAFDSDPVTIVPLQRDQDRKAIAVAIDHLQSGGGTDGTSGLRGAIDELHASKLKVKHVLVLSDGESPTDGVKELVEKMKDDNITTSAIGVAGADQSLLAMIAKAGNGRFVMVDDLTTLGKSFVQELKTALP